MATDTKGGTPLVLLVQLQLGLFALCLAEVHKSLELS